MDTALKKTSYLFRLLLTLALCTAVFIYAARHYFSAPADFPVPYELHIDKGQTLFSISNELATDHVIRSPRMFEMFMIALGSERAVSEGDYSFSAPVSVLEVAMRISGRQFGVERTKVTFPEGFTVNDMANRLVANFEGFDVERFRALTKDSEGYLFPDTYRFFPSVTADIVVNALKQNFTAKLAPLEKEIAASKRSRADIIIMASIIEKEANGADDRAVISGILWKRIDQGLALQVDAPFLFLLDKESSELTRKDLATKSPYNTYLNKGLPPTPINNPGLAAITAAIHPVSSPYLYYLHDKTGQIHYARTYTEHKKNIALYLH